MVGDNATRAVTTLWAFRPVSSDDSATSVRASIPAHTSSRTASAISVTIKLLCTRFEVPAIERPPARSAASRPDIGTRSAGASPNARPLAIDTTTAAANTRQSR